MQGKEVLPAHVLLAGGEHRLVFVDESLLHGKAGRFIGLGVGALVARVTVQK